MRIITPEKERVDKFVEAESEIEHHLVFEKESQTQNRLAKRVVTPESCKQKQKKVSFSPDLNWEIEYTKHDRRREWKRSVRISSSSGRKSNKHGKKKHESESSTEAKHAMSNLENAGAMQPMHPSQRALTSSQRSSPGGHTELQDNGILSTKFTDDRHSLASKFKAVNHYAMWADEGDDFTPIEPNALELEQQQWWQQLSPENRQILGETATMIGFQRYWNDNIKRSYLTLADRSNRNDLLYLAQTNPEFLNLARKALASMGYGLDRDERLSDLMVFPGVLADFSTGARNSPAWRDKEEATTLLEKLKRKFFDVKLLRKSELLLRWGVQKAKESKQSRESSSSDSSSSYSIESGDGSYKDEAGGSKENESTNSETTETAPK